jgi:divalent metal cation (Fe/Co/Zn/Cd) transporter
VAEALSGAMPNWTLCDPGGAVIAVTALLEREGVRSFCDSYHQLLGCIERKIAAGAGR